VRRWAALGAVLLMLGVGLWLRLTGFEVTAENVIAQVRLAGAAWWGPLAYVGLYLVLVSVAVPAMVFHIAAGVLWGFGPGAVIGFVASNLVSNLHFAFGRSFGAGPLSKVIERRGLTALFDRARTEGPWLMFAIRQLPLPVPFVVLCVAAGSSAIPWWHFLVGSGLGGLVPLLIWTWFADAAFHDAEGARPIIVAKALGAAALALGMAFAWRWLASRLKGAPKDRNAAP
jgi:uncharacterized membrane protein YdjX (TVP38/TMEM64 family)